MSEGPSRDSRFTALDWIGVTLAVGLALSLSVAPWIVGQAFAAMFRDFGAVLPLITRLALSPLFPPAIALLPFALALAGALTAAPLALRRAMVVVAFVLGLLAWAGYLFALYAPLFQLAGKVK